MAGVLQRGTLGLLLGIFWHFQDYGMVGLSFRGECEMVCVVQGEIPLEAMGGIKAVPCLQPQGQHMERI